MRPIIGYNFGGKNFKRLWDTVKLASIGIMVFLAVITILMVIFAPQIVGVFTQNPDLLRESVPVLRIMLSTMVVVGPTVLFITTFQGLFKGKLALFLSMLRQFLIFLPILFLLRHLFGLWGVWWAMPASDIFSFLLTLVFILRERRKAAKTGFSHSSGV